MRSPARMRRGPTRGWPTSCTPRGRRGRRRRPAAPGAAVHPAVEQAARILRDESATLPELAARVGLSASRLSRVFAAQTGVSVTDFRNRQRITRFLRLYGGGRTTLTDAALRAGFGSYPQFHRVYTGLMGEPPRALRGRRAPPLPPAPGPG